LKTQLLLVCCTSHPQRYVTDLKRKICCQVKKEISWHVHPRTHSGKAKMFIRVHHKKRKSKQSNVHDSSSKISPYQQSTATFAPRSSTLSTQILSQQFLINQATSQARKYANQASLAFSLNAAINPPVLASCPSGSPGSSNSF